jgi:hypothetical protein
MPTSYGGSEMPPIAESKSSQLSDGITSVLVNFYDEEIKEIGEFSSTNEQALHAFIRSAISNQLFIRKIYLEKGEFLLRKPNGNFHRVTFF